MLLCTITKGTNPQIKLTLTLTNNNMSYGQEWQITKLAHLICISYGQEWQITWLAHLIFLSVKHHTLQNKIPTLL